MTPFMRLLAGKSSEKLWAFDMPSPFGGNAYVTMTEAEIIKYQMARDDVTYESEQQALDDFLVVHWCYEHKPQSQQPTKVAIDWALPAHHQFPKMNNPNPPGFNSSTLFPQDPNGPTPTEQSSGDWKTVAELQRLCERAYTILNENWDSFTNSTGYGPTSLLRDLEKASQGTEYKSLTNMHRILHDMFEGLQAKHEEAVNNIQDLKTSYNTMCSLHRELQQKYEKLQLEFRKQETELHNAVASSSLFQLRLRKACEEADV